MWDGKVGVNTWTALDKYEKLFGWQCEWPSSLSLTGIGGVDTLEKETNLRPWNRDQIQQFPIL
ncbi:hypothetical protein [Dolichospermum flos-aquae]|uniref:Uncharacterized protein n=1 Tax=Dolichospermum flos-aquae LEGE 04289 TaxID=1828708 RepID=A0ACC5Q1M1_DOLFA|nr:hypothetical protein [Dolichospermum flos-aquae]MBE9218542.1 hypothetical protein [Dolichospermum flos-aquae LEGE 04289]